MVGVLQEAYVKLEYVIALKPVSRLQKRIMSPANAGNHSVFFVCGSFYY